MGSYANGVGRVQRVRRVGTWVWANLGRLSRSAHSVLYILLGPSTVHAPERSWPSWLELGVIGCGASNNGDVKVMIIDRQ